MLKENGVYWFQRSAKVRYKVLIKDICNGSQDNTYYTFRKIHDCTGDVGTKVMGSYDEKKFTPIKNAVIVHRVLFL